MPSSLSAPFPAPFSAPYPIVQTIFTNAASRRPVAADHLRTADQFSAHWQNLGSFEEVLRPEDAAHVSLCQLQPGHDLGPDSIECVTGIVLDIVRFCDPEDRLADILARLPGCCAAFARFDSVPGQPLWRVLVPLAEPVSAEDFEACQLPLSLAKKLNVAIDPACLQADAVYALPCRPTGFLSTPRLDSPYIICVQAHDALLSLADLDVVEDGDAEAFLAAAPARPALALAAPRPAQHAVYAEMDAYVAEHRQGVAPIWAESSLHFFDGVIWKSMSHPALVRELMVQVFQEQRSPQQVTQFAHAMRQRYFEEVFPSPHHGRSYRIALANGTVDPILGRQVPNDAANYLRSQLAFDFDPEASCPRWQRFLQEVFAHDEDRGQKIDFLQEMFGYLLIPSTHHHVMFWLYGGGSNGKSVVLKVITWLLGSGNVSTVPITKLGQRFYLAQLVGKLANLSDEMGANAVLDDEVLKQTISGGRQQAERKGEQPFDFEPYARIVASTNTLPRTVDKSFGFFRRVRILRFTRTFSPAEQDPHLPATLQRESPGIFNWALQGLQRLERQGGFSEVPSSLQAQQAYRAASDPVRAFVKECLRMPATTPSTGTKAKPAKTLTSTVFRAFLRYCEDHGYQALDDSYFGRALKELGLQAQRSNGQRFYPVVLRDSDSDCEV